MSRPTPALPLLLAAVVVATTLRPVAAQDLRRALVDADLVAVARQIGKQAANDDVDLHRLQIVSLVRGGNADLRTVAVIDWPKLSLHNRPQPRQSRLYCLHDATREAQRLGLPAADGPYYRMSGRHGSNPLVGAEDETVPVLAFARALAAAEAGAPPAGSAASLLAMALGTDPVVRLEATRHFSEQPLLRTHVSPLQWNQVLSHASAESEDIAYKIALAELCAEQRVDGTVEALVVGLAAVRDRDYVRTVGRLCAHLRGDDAAAPLLARLQTTADAETRARLLLAIGATQTGPALDALLRLKGDRADAAVDAALREHGSARAQEAALRGNK